MFKLTLLVGVVLQIAELVSGQCSSLHPGGSCINYRFGSCLVGQYYTFDGCGQEEMCCFPNHAALNVPPIAPNQCGLSTPVTSNTKIVGGSVAKVGEFPWQVSLRNMGQHICGGILIDKKWVLTAAHCFEGNHYPKTWSVVVGENDRAYVEGQEKIMKVDTLFVHSSFDAKQYVNDIAMLLLEDDVSINAYVRPVCLPSASETYDYETCVITGWGAAFTGGHGTHALYKANIPILPRTVCSYLLSRELPSSMICAGLKQGGVDTCQGDSGGPLVCLKNGVYEIAGIVSWGYSCAAQYTPGVYTNVPEYIGWIHSVINAYDPGSSLLKALGKRDGTEDAFVRYD